MSLRTLNHMRGSSAVLMGRQFRLDFSRVTREQFEQRRRGYHQQMQSDYFATHHIVGTEAYIARRGDSLWSVTQRSALPVWLLQQYNPDVDFAELRPGNLDCAASRRGRFFESSTTGCEPCTVAAGEADPYNRRMSYRFLTALAFLAATAAGPEPATLTASSASQAGVASWRRAGRPADGRFAPSVRKVPAADVPAEWRAA